MTASPEKSLILYGRPSSRASRCLWVLEELGHPYELVPIDYTKGENRTAEYLSRNPSGKIPTLVDGDMILTESLAICVHLARQYGAGTLWPDSTREQASALQWLFWCATELEPPASALVDELLLTKDPATRDARRIEREQRRAAQALERLKRHLDRRENVLGSAFSVVDVALASVGKWLKGIGFDLTPYPQVTTWLVSALARPAYQRVLNIKQGKPAA